jgi:hypothetical protein
VLLRAVTARWLVDVRGHPPAAADDPQHLDPWEIATIPIDAH